MVHYVLADYDAVHEHVKGEHRAAIVVGVNSGGSVNLQVFLDGSNDAIQHILHPDYPDAKKEIPRFILWATSRMNDDDTMAPGTWHWPEREAFRVNAVDAEKAALTPGILYPVDHAGNPVFFQPQAMPIHIHKVYETEQQLDVDQTDEIMKAQQAKEFGQQAPAENEVMAVIDKRRIEVHEALESQKE